MKLPKLPDSYRIEVNDRDYEFFFDYDPGEGPWFDFREGVGGPGYPARVTITKINQGDVELPESDLILVEQEIMDRIDAEAKEYWESYREGAGE